MATLEKMRDRMKWCAKVIVLGRKRVMIRSWFSITSTTQTKSNLGPGRAEVGGAVFEEAQCSASCHLMTLQNRASVKIGHGRSLEIQPLEKGLCLNSSHLSSPFYLSTTHMLGITPARERIHCVFLILWCAHCKHVQERQPASVLPSNTARLYWVVDAKGLQVVSNLLP